MLVLTGDSSRLCDGVSRCSLLVVGGPGVPGLLLSDLLRAENASGISRRRRSVILVWQHGGPSQLDTFDMKPDAPSEVRGPYKSIPTNVSGIRVCEKLPCHAKVIDKMTII